MSNARCRCETCQAAFCSVTAFDMHRTGDFANARAKRPCTRRCMSVTEMRAKGMKQTASGAWSTGREVVFSGAA